MAALQKTYAVADTAAQADSKTDTTTDGTRVSLSSTGIKLANSVENLNASDALITPTTANVQNLSAALAEKVGNLFRDAGISTDQQVQFSVDATGNVKVTAANEKDAAKIKDLLDQNPAVADEIRTLNAVGSQTQAMESMGLVQQNTAFGSDTQQHIAAKYAALFSSLQPAAEMTIHYGGNQVMLMADGKLWRGTIQAG